MFSKSIIKYIQSLQHKKFRDEHNAFIAEGPKVVGELISSGKFDCNNIYATDEWIDRAAKVLPATYGSKVTRVQDFELEKLTGLSTANLVIAEFQKKASTEKINFKNKITLMLDDIRDPGNFGTIIRIADWFGIENIVCSEQTVDMYNPKVVQSTMASLGRVNIIYTDMLQLVKNNPNIKTYAAALEGRKLNEIEIREGIIIIGNESHGINKVLLETANEKITIERYGSAESLNAAVATGIILYAVRGKSQ